MRIRASLLVALLAGTACVSATAASAPATHPAAADPIPGTDCSVFPGDNVWNTDVSALPVHPKNDAWLASMNAATTKLHPDFGRPPYGMPYAVVDDSHATVLIRFQYANESDRGPYPFGPDIPLEQGSDRHALMVNKDTCVLYELYAANWNGGNPKAGSGAIFDLGSNALRPDDWTSADAAGLPILPGLVRVDEVRSGLIAHAIRFTADLTDCSHLWPARHDAGTCNSNYPPMGARFRMKASFSLSGFSAPVRVILRAMKRYGMILADNGSDWYFQGTEDPQWTNAILDQLKTVPASAFEAVDESACQVGADSAQAVCPDRGHPWHRLGGDVTDPTQVLGAVAGGVLGEGFAPEVAIRMRSRIEQLPSADRRKLLSVLRLLAAPGGSILATGRAKPVSRLPGPEAEALIRRWQRSHLAAKRGLAKALVALATSSLYGHPGPEWERLGYPGPLGPAPEVPRRLSPMEIDHPQELVCDVVVVGSGAGGGCAAAVLAAAGLDVVVLEKGGYHAEADFNHLEMESLSSLYLYGGALTTTDLGVAVIAGSTLGGGTVVNYTTAFRTPPAVLREWASTTGVDAFGSGEFEESLDEVTARVGMNSESHAPSMRDQLMEEGLEKLGWHVAPLARAVRGCPQDDGCGYCGFGCRTGAKQGTLVTYLEDAAGKGARMVVGADVRRLSIRDGRATGVQAVVNGHRLSVTARAVAVAGGAIETPALLLRSGLRRQVGTNLRLHPGVGTLGLFDQEVRPWTGTLQARYSSELAGLDGEYGLFMETVPLHPGQASAALPWTSARQHRELMGKLANVSVCGAAPRDRSQGRVEVARDGSVRVGYRLSPTDERMLIEGVIASGKIMEAAGATEVLTLHDRPISYHPASGAHERWAQEVRSRGVRGKLTCFSFHQMGSCRMGSDPARSAVGPDNESHEVQNLFVVDASTFPTALGVNPMITVYGIANRAAKKIAARLG